MAGLLTPQTEPLKQALNPPKEPKAVTTPQSKVIGHIKNDRGGIHRYVHEGEKVPEKHWGRFVDIRSVPNATNANISPAAPKQLQPNSNASNIMPINTSVSTQAASNAINKQYPDSNYVFIGRNKVLKSSLPKDYQTQIASREKLYGDKNYFNSLGSNGDAPLKYYIEEERGKLFNAYNAALSKKDSYGAALAKHSLDMLDMNLYNNHLPAMYRKATAYGYGTGANNDFYLNTGVDLQQYLDTKPVHITEDMHNNNDLKGSAAVGARRAIGAGLAASTFIPGANLAARAASLTNSTMGGWKLATSMYYWNMKAKADAEGDRKKAAIYEREALNAETAENMYGDIATGDIVMGLGVRALTTNAGKYALKKWFPAAAKASQRLATSAAFNGMPSVLANRAAYLEQAASTVVPFVSNNKAPAAAADVVVNAVANTGKKDPNQATDPSARKDIETHNQVVDKARDMRDKLTAMFRASRAQDINEHINKIRFEHGAEAAKIEEQYYTQSFNAYNAELAKLKSSGKYDPTSAIMLANNKFFSIGHVPKQFYDTDEWKNATPEQRTMLFTSLTQSHMLAGTKPKSGLSNFFGYVAGSLNLYGSLKKDADNKISAMWKQNTFLREQMSQAIKATPDSYFLSSNGTSNDIGIALVGQVTRDDPKWGAGLMLRGLKQSYSNGKLNFGSSKMNKQLKNYLQENIRNIHAIYNKEGKKGLTAFFAENMTGKEAVDIGLALLNYNNSDNKADSLFDPETSKLITTSFEGMVKQKFKDDPIGMAPGMTALFAAKHGYGDVAKYLKDPTNFWITAGLILIGGVALGGSMLNMFGDSSEKGTLDSSIDEDAMAYKRRLRRLHANSIYNDIFSNYKGNI